ncbi:hypothetical protein D7Z26_23505 [Cohnella endophytica]|uniref:S-layer homology domain-containing protein n=1 Tax=Cohnella endophytica TaxID=2419778 RepID=A0A494XI94_9BACL|nr:S-layer homology domain-containing protein [Cohnella endophytica]RKP47273.1 hypothetical protein D7Z26_23505 [Cohnella endophytica]
MRDSSYNSSKQTKQIFSRGGEKKVMKKSLSLILMLTLVFGLFANMAAAADAAAPSTTAEKYKWFVDAGILKGTPDGDVHAADKLTRAEFATIAVAVAGLTPATSGNTFSDVKVGQWYFGAIEAAAKAGLVNGSGAGKFSPKANVTVESIIKVAATIAKLKTEDGVKVTGSSDWAGPYIKAALEAGLISEGLKYTADATRGQTIDIAFAVAQAGQTALEVKASKENVAVGEAVTVTSSKAGATFSVTGDAIVTAAGKFVATAPGVYTVTATVGAQSGTVKISVYGAVAGLKVVAPAEIVANNESEYDISVQAVDKNGSVVEGYNGTVDIKIVNAAATLVNGPAQITNATVTNGVAKAKIKSGSVAGVTSTITALNLQNVANVTATADVKTVSQVATKIDISAPTYVEANAATTATATVQVLDQSGKTMKSGVYGLTVSLTGALKFASGNQDTYSTSYIAGTPTPISLKSQLGVVGTSSLNVTGTNLTAASATINAVVVGVEKKLAAGLSTSTTTLDQGATTLTVNLSSLDVNGYPKAGVAGVTPKVFVTKADGSAAIGINVGATPVANGDGIALTAGATSFTLNAPNGQALAGEYNVVVKDSAGNLTAADAIKFSVNVGDKAKLSLSVGQDTISASNPTTTVTVKLTDANGNKVKESGVAVSINAARAAGTGTSSINGGTAPVTVYTDANGEATATYTAQPYNGNAWTLTASNASLTASAGKTITVSYIVPTQMGVSITAFSTSTSQAVAGEVVKVVVSAKDQYGSDATVGTHNVKVTITPDSALSGVNAPALGSKWTDGGKLYLEGSITAVNAVLSAASVKADKAGLLSVTVENTSVPQATQGSSAINVVPGAFSGFKVFDVNGKDLSADKLAVTANTPVQVFVKPVDANGNAVVTPYTYNVTLTPNGGGFRSTTDGANLTSVTVNAGTIQTAVYYVNPTADSYNISAPSFVPGYTQTATTVTVSGAATVAHTGPTANYTVAVLDQYGTAIATPTVVWTVSTTGAAGSVTINNSGVLTLTGTAAAGDVVTVTATSGTVVGTKTVTLS